MRLLIISILPIPICASLLITSIPLPTRVDFITATKFSSYFRPILKKLVCGCDFTTTIDRTKGGISKCTLLGTTEKFELDIKIEAAKQSLWLEVVLVIKC